MGGREGLCGAAILGHCYRVLQNLCNRIPPRLLFYIGTQVPTTLLLLPNKERSWISWIFGLQVLQRFCKTLYRGLQVGCHVIMAVRVNSIVVEQCFVVEQCTVAIKLQELDTVITTLVFYRGLQVGCHLQNAK